MLPLPRGAVWQTLFLLSAVLFINEVRSEGRVVCYYTNWSVYRPGTAKFNPQNINPYLCTHLVYAFGGFTKDNQMKPFDKYQDIEQGGYAKFTGLKTYNKQLKTMIAIGGWNEASSRFSPLVASPERRQQFIKNILKFLRQNHFDGIDLDWEYPAHREGGKPRDRDNYAQFVQELRAEFERESEKTGRPRLLLTMAVPAGIEYIEKGYDIPKLNKYLDWFNVLTYDFHSSHEPSANHHAPLYSLEEESEYNYDAELNIDYSIKFYLKAGADRDKLVLGIPTYGRSYTLINEESTEIGAPSEGPGEQGDATREKGYLAYYEICQNLKEDPEWTVVQPNPSAMGPYAYRRNQWVGYDDEDIVRKKAEYVVENNLGGIMFWAIDNDDFRGICGGKPYPLIEAAKDAMLEGLGLGINEVAKPSSPKKPLRSRSRENSSSTRNRISSGDEEKPRKETIRRPTSSGGNRNRVQVSTTARPSTTIRLTESEGSSLYIGGRTTTPAPPTTPDPGTDFKCEEEGFFQHPRDCKKYYWCLDSGPSGLGIVAHQFTCPSGLYFNPAADSCDFARNVPCKTKKSTTAAPITSTSTTTTTPRPTASVNRITAATARNSFLRTTTTTTTTAAPIIHEEEYDDDDEIRTHYKDKDAEEDPQVIKELIELIRKVGGIEELEKHLLRKEDGTIAIKENNSDADAATTPSPISKSLYDKVLSRPNTFNSFRNRFTSSTLYRNSGATTQTKAEEISAGRTKFEEDESQSGERSNSKSSGSSYSKYSSVVRGGNSRQGPQSEGLEKLAEFDGFLKEKKQYVTINRNRGATRAQESDAEEDEDEENLAHNTEEQETAEQIKSSRQPVSTATPAYVSIKRTRPTTTAPEGAQDETSKEVEEKKTYTSLNRHHAKLTTTGNAQTTEEVASTTNRYKHFERSRPTKVTTAIDEEDADAETEEEQENVTVHLKESNEITQQQRSQTNTRNYASIGRRTTTTTTATPETPTTTTTTTTNNNNIPTIKTHSLETTTTITNETPEPIYQTSTTTSSTPLTSTTNPALISTISTPITTTTRNGEDGSSETNTNITPNEISISAKNSLDLSLDVNSLIQESTTSSPTSSTPLPTSEQTTTESGLDTAKQDTEVDDSSSSELTSTTNAAKTTTKTLTTTGTIDTDSPVNDEVTSNKNISKTQYKFTTRTRNTTTTTNNNDNVSTTTNNNTNDTSLNSVGISSSNNNVRGNSVKYSGGRRQQQQQQHSNELLNRKSQQTATSTVTTTTEPITPTNEFLGTVSSPRPFGFPRRRGRPTVSSIAPAADEETQRVNEHKEEDARLVKQTKQNAVNNYKVSSSSAEEVDTNAKGSTTRTQTQAQTHVVDVDVGSSGTSHSGSGSNLLHAQNSLSSAEVATKVESHRVIQSNTLTGASKDERFASKYGKSLEGTGNFRSRGLKMISDEEDESTRLHANGETTKTETEVNEGNGVTRKTTTYITTYNSSEGNESVNGGFGGFNETVLPNGLATTTTNETITTNEDGSITKKTTTTTTSVTAEDSIVQTSVENFNNTVVPNGVVSKSTDETVTTDEDGTITKKTTTHTTITEEDSKVESAVESLNDTVVPNGIVSTTTNETITTDEDGNITKTTTTYTTITHEDGEVETSVKEHVEVIKSSSVPQENASFKSTTGVKVVGADKTVTTDGDSTITKKTTTHTTITEEDSKVESAIESLNDTVVPNGIVSTTTNETITTNEDGTITKTTTTYTTITHENGEVETSVKENVEVVESSSVPQENASFTSTTGVKVDGAEDGITTVKNRVVTTKTKETFFSDDDDDSLTKQTRKHGGVLTKKYQEISRHTESNSHPETETLHYKAITRADDGVHLTDAESSSFYKNLAEQAESNKQRLYQTISRGGKIPGSSTETSQEIETTKLEASESAEKADEANKSRHYQTFSRGGTISGTSTETTQETETTSTSGEDNASGINKYKHLNRGSLKENDSSEKSVETNKQSHFQGISRGGTTTGSSTETTHKTETTSTFSEGSASGSNKYKHLNRGSFKENDSGKISGSSTETSQETESSKTESTSKEESASGISKYKHLNRGSLKENDSSEKSIETNKQTRYQGISRGGATSVSSTEITQESDTTSTSSEGSSSGLNKYKHLNRGSSKENDSAEKLDESNKQSHFKTVSRGSGKISVSSTETSQETESSKTESTSKEDSASGISKYKYLNRDSSKENESSEKSSDANKQSHYQGISRGGAISGTSTETAQETETTSTSSEDSVNTASGKNQHKHINRGSLKENDSSENSVEANKQSHYQTISRGSGKISGSTTDTTQETETTSTSHESSSNNAANVNKYKHINRGSLKENDSSEKSVEINKQSHYQTLSRGSGKISGSSTETSQETETTKTESASNEDSASGKNKYKHLNRGSSKESDSSENSVEANKQNRYKSISRGGTTSGTSTETTHETETTSTSHANRGSSKESNSAEKLAEAKKQSHYQTISRGSGKTSGSSTETSQETETAKHESMSHEESANLATGIKRYQHSNRGHSQENESTEKVDSKNESNRFNRRKFTSSKESVGDSTSHRVGVQSGSLVKNVKTETSTNTQTVSKELSAEIEDLDIAKTSVKTDKKEQQVDENVGAEVMDAETEATIKLVETTTPVAIETTSDPAPSTMVAESESSETTVAQTEAAIETTTESATTQAVNDVAETTTRKSFFKTRGTTTTESSAEATTTDDSIDSTTRRLLLRNRPTTESSTSSEEAKLESSTRKTLFSKQTRVPTTTESATDPTTTTESLIEERSTRKSFLKNKTKPSSATTTEAVTTSTEAATISDEPSEEVTTKRTLLKFKRPLTTTTAEPATTTVSNEEEVTTKRTLYKFKNKSTTESTPSSPEPTTETSAVPARKTAFRNRVKTVTVDNSSESVSKSDGGKESIEINGISEDDFHNEYFSTTEDSLSAGRHTIYRGTYRPRKDGEDLSSLLALDRNKQYHSTTKSPYTIGRRRRPVERTTTVSEIEEEENFIKSTRPTRPTKFIKEEASETRTHIRGRHEGFHVTDVDGDAVEINKRLHTGGNTEAGHSGRRTAVVRRRILKNSAAISEQTAEEQAKLKAATTSAEEENVERKAFVDSQAASLVEDAKLTSHATKLESGSSTLALSNLNESSKLEGDASIASSLNTTANLKSEDDTKSHVDTNGTISGVDTTSSFDQNSSGPRRGQLVLRKRLNTTSTTTESTITNESTPTDLDTDSTTRRTFVRPNRLRTTAAPSSGETNETDASTETEEKQTKQKATLSTTRRSFVRPNSPTTTTTSIKTTQEKEIFDEPEVSTRRTFGSFNRFRSTTASAIDENENEEESSSTESKIDSTTRRSLVKINRFRTTIAPSSAEKNEADADTNSSTTNESDSTESKIDSTTRRTLIKLNRFRTTAVPSSGERTEAIESDSTESKTDFTTRRTFVKLTRPRTTITPASGEKTEADVDFTTTESSNSDESSSTELETDPTTRRTLIQLVRLRTTTPSTSGEQKEDEESITGSTTVSKEEDDEVEAEIDEDESDADEKTSAVRKYSNITRRPFTTEKEIDSTSTESSITEVSSSIEKETNATTRRTLIKLNRLRTTIAPSSGEKNEVDADEATDEFSSTKAETSSTTRRTFVKLNRLRTTAVPSSGEKHETDKEKEDQELTTEASSAIIPTKRTLVQTNRHRALFTKTRENQILSANKDLEESKSKETEINSETDSTTKRSFARPNRFRTTAAPASYEDDDDNGNVDSEEKETKQTGIASTTRRSFIRPNRLGTRVPSADDKEILDEPEISTRRTFAGFNRFRSTTATSVEENEVDEESSSESKTDSSTRRSVIKFNRVRTTAAPFSEHSSPESSNINESNSTESKIDSISGDEEIEAELDITTTGNSISDENSSTELETNSTTRRTVIELVPSVSQNETDIMKEEELSKLSETNSTTTAKATVSDEEDDEVVAEIDDEDESDSDEKVPNTTEREYTSTTRPLANETDESTPNTTEIKTDSTPKRKLIKVVRLRTTALPSSGEQNETNIDSNSKESTITNESSSTKPESDSTTRRTFARLNRLRTTTAPSSGEKNETDDVKGDEESTTEASSAIIPTKRTLLQANRQRALLTRTRENQIQSGSKEIESKQTEIKSETDSTTKRSFVRPNRFRTTAAPASDDNLETEEKETKQIGTESTTRRSFGRPNRLGTTAASTDEEEIQDELEASTRRTFSGFNRFRSSTASSIEEKEIDEEHIDSSTQRSFGVFSQKQRPTTTRRPLAFNRNIYKRPEEEDEEENDYSDENEAPEIKPFNLRRPQFTTTERARQQLPTRKPFNRFQTKLQEQDSESYSEEDEDFEDEDSITDDDNTPPKILLPNRSPLKLATTERSSNLANLRNRVKLAQTQDDKEEGVVNDRLKTLLANRVKSNLNANKGKETTSDNSSNDDERTTNKQTSSFIANRSNTNRSSTVANYFNRTKTNLSLKSNISENTESDDISRVESNDDKKNDNEDDDDSSSDNDAKGNEVNSKRRFQKYQFNRARVTTAATISNASSNRAGTNSTTANQVNELVEADDGHDEPSTTIDPSTASASAAPPTPRRIRVLKYRRPLGGGAANTTTLVDSKSSNATATISATNQTDTVTNSLDSSSKFVSNSVREQVVKSKTETDANANSETTQTLTETTLANGTTPTKRFRKVIRKLIRPVNRTAEVTNEETEESKTQTQSSDAATTSTFNLRKQNGTRFGYNRSSNTFGSNAKKETENENESAAGTDDKSTVTSRTSLFGTANRSRYASNSPTRTTVSDDEDDEAEAEIDDDESDDDDDDKVTTPGGRKYFSITRKPYVPGSDSSTTEAATEGDTESTILPSRRPFVFSRPSTTAKPANDEDDDEPVAENDDDDDDDEDSDVEKKPGQKSNDLQKLRDKVKVEQARGDQDKGVLSTRFKTIQGNRNNDTNEEHNEPASGEEKEDPLQKIRNKVKQEQARGDQDKGVISTRFKSLLAQKNATTTHEVEHKETTSDEGESDAALPRPFAPRRPYTPIVRTGGSQVENENDENTESTTNSPSTRRPTFRRKLIAKRPYVPPKISASDLSTTEKPTIPASAKPKRKFVRQKFGRFHPFNAANRNTGEGFVRTDPRGSLLPGAERFKHENRTRGENGDEDYEEYDYEDEEDETTVQAKPALNVRPFTPAVLKQPVLFNRPQTTILKKPVEKKEDGEEEDADENDEDDDEDSEEEKDDEEKKTAAPKFNSPSFRPKDNRAPPGARPSLATTGTGGNAPFNSRNQPSAANRFGSSTSSNRFGTGTARVTNRPRVVNRPPGVAAPSLSIKPVASGDFEPTTPPTKPAPFISTNTRTYERKYTATSTETPETNIDNSLIEDLNIDALNARNKKIFDINSKKHTTLKPKIISTLGKSSTTDTDTEQSQHTRLNTDTENDDEYSAQSEAGGQGYLTTTPSNTDTVYNANANEISSQDGESGGVSTTTPPTTTLLHIFTLTDDGQTNRPPTDGGGPIPRLLPERGHPKHKVIEVNRIVEITSKEDKLRRKSKANQEFLKSVGTSSLKVESLPHVEQLGEISVVKYVHLVDGSDIEIDGHSTVADYTPTEANVGRVSVPVRNSLPQEGAREYAQLNAGPQYVHDYSTEAVRVYTTLQERYGKALIPEVIREAVETSTISLEGLFENARKAKELNIVDGSYNSLHENLPTEENGNAATTTQATLAAFTSNIDSTLSTESSTSASSSTVETTTIAPLADYTVFASQVYATTEVTPDTTFTVTPDEPVTYTSQPTTTNEPAAEITESTTKATTVAAALFPTYLRTPTATTVSRRPVLSVRRRIINSPATSVPTTTNTAVNSNDSAVTTTASDLATTSKATSSSRNRASNKNYLSNTKYKSKFTASALAGDLSLASSAASATTTASSSATASANDITAQRHQTTKFPASAASAALRRKFVTRRLTTTTTSATDESATDAPRTQNPLFKRRFTLTSTPPVTITPPSTSSSGGSTPTTKLAATATTALDALTTTLYVDGIDSDDTSDQVAKSSIHTSHFNQLLERHGGGEEDEQANAPVSAIKTLAKAAPTTQTPPETSLNFVESITRRMGTSPATPATPTTRRAVIKRRPQKTTPIPLKTAANNGNNFVGRRRAHNYAEPFNRLNANHQQAATKTPSLAPGRTYRPTIDYDYYDDGDERIVGNTKGQQLKVILHGRGIIECLDQGNFPHPLSCRKFISCAKFETGGVVGWEYTCPKGLSYDPVGGMCNWAAGLGCKE